MPVLSRNYASSSSALLMHILERPELVSAVRELPSQALGMLIDRIGLEDAGELVALASTEQLERIFADDLWKAAGAGEDERFRPDRFALWLTIMLEAGEEVLVQRLVELPQDLLVLAIHHSILVLDMDVLAEEANGSMGEEYVAIERALESADFEEWEEFRLIPRDPMHWDELWVALLALDRDHHDRLHEILEQCCALSTEYISGNGGLFQVLTSEEMLEGDVAAAREDRRASEGFVSPADARSFLALAKTGENGAERDPVTRAYFRELTPAPTQATSAAQSRPNELMKLLTSAKVIDHAALQPLAALATDAVPARKGRAKRGQQLAAASKGRRASLFESAMTELRHADPVLFSQRIEELSYLVNVLIAGSSRDGRRPRPIEALEEALTACEAGVHAALGERASEAAVCKLVATTPADVLFRRGYAKS